MKMFRVLVIAALVLLLAGSFASAEEQKVIGKAHIGEGAMILLLVPAQGGMQMVPAISGKDQVFYITDKMVQDDKFVYIGDATGFIVLCRQHGPEEIPVPMLLFAIPGDALDASGNGLNGNPIRVEIF